MTLVIKATVTHSRRSYGNSDDQYDNESVGPTKTALKLEKLMENSCRNKKNGYEVKMGSRQDNKNKNKNKNTNNQRPRMDNNRQEKQTQTQLYKQREYNDQLNNFFHRHRIQYRHEWNSRSNNQLSNKKK
jgi:hypothetical protein